MPVRKYLLFVSVASTEMTRAPFVVLTASRCVPFVIARSPVPQVDGFPVGDRLRPEGATYLIELIREDEVPSCAVHGRGSLEGGGRGVWVDQTALGEGGEALSAFGAHFDSDKHFAEDYYKWVAKEKSEKAKGEKMRGEDVEKAACADARARVSVESLVGIEIDIFVVLIVRSGCGRGCSAVVASALCVVVLAA